MSTPTISAAAEAAREAHRDDHGRFGTQPASEADVDLSATASLDEPDEDDEPEGFDHRRISSLMGDAYHLDPERKVALPRFSEDDTIAQIHHKLNRYLAKTQDLSDMDDAELMEMAGGTLDPDGEMPESRRSYFGISDGDRLLVGSNDKGRTVYLSVGNTARKTGEYYERHGGGRYKVVNAADVTVQPRMKAEFAADHPELDDVTVDQLFRRLNGSYRGKGHRYLWTENTLSRTSEFRVDMARRAAGLSHHMHMTDHELGEWATSLPRDEEGRGVVTGPGGTSRLVMDTVTEDLDGTSSHALSVAANKAYREWITEKLADEHDFTLQRKYVRDNSGDGGARVFEQKKNVPQTHLDAAETSTFRTSGDFRHVEVDSDTDLGKLEQIGAEYERLRAHLPRTDSTPALRFRKTGRHQAMGVYHPHVDNIAVDPRHPSSFVHEFVHHVDHTAGDRNLSSEQDFRSILRGAQRGVSATPGLTRSRSDYLRTPTEVHARSAEAYFHWKGYETSLNGDEGKYADDPAYTTLEPMREEIIDYWDAKLVELGVEPPTARGHLAASA